MTAVEAAARVLNVKLEVLDIPAIGDVALVFAAAEQRRPDAAIALPSPTFGTNPKLIGDQALLHRLAIATLFPDVARHGGLLSYGPNIPDTFRQLGTMVGKVLQGTKSADLPVERPTKFELVVNLKTAKALGLTVPPSVLARVDEVIE
jgi:putative ABC transport system substrate-binding protein